MRLGRLALALAFMACLIPAYFFGASFLEGHRIEMPLQPHPFLALWLVVALFLYWRWAYQDTSWRQLLSFCLYGVVLAALVFLGLTASFWAVVSVYGL